jgi:hypothetical protein
MSLLHRLSKVQISPDKAVIVPAEATGGMQVYPSG